MFFIRTLLDSLTSPVSQGKVRLLFGARQTGKTVLLKYTLPEGETWRTDLSMTSDRRRYETHPETLRRELGALGPQIRNVVVDEIQKAPRLLDEIQNLYDEDRDRFQFYLTGSSARKLRRESANLLPGRCHVFQLFPTCRWEVQSPVRHDWPGAERKRKKGVQGNLPPFFPEQGLERTLLFGNLPGVREESDETAAATLTAYVENYLEEEVRREALARDLGAFAIFLKLAAIESGGQVNIARLSQESGVPAGTLNGYYDVLVDTFVGHWLRPYRRPGRKRLLTTPRFFLFDVGVRNAAAALPLTRGLLEVEGPRLLEHWVGLELAYRAAYLGRGYDVRFWRTVTGAEVDFVFETPGEDVPIEVKWTEHPHPSDARHVETFIDLYPRRARHGLVICRSPRAQRLTDRVTAVPWDQF